MPIAQRDVLCVCFVASMTLIATALANGCTTERNTAWRTVQPQPAQLDDAIRRAISDDAERQRLLGAIDRSIVWLDREDSRALFPVGGITRDDALHSARAFRRIISENDSDTIAQALLARFEFIARRADDEIYGREAGSVLVTGYYAPEFRGSRIRTAVYRYPLYAKPPDLDPARGARAQPYPTRGEIEATGMLAGSEVVWLADPFDAYVVHVNGSARIALPDGSHLNVGHSGTNDGAYTSIGRLLIDDGRIRADEMSLQAIRAYFAAHPDQFDHYARQNDRYVFFEVLRDDSWPRGSLGIVLTPWRSIAVDKSVFPAGGPALLITEIADDSGGSDPLAQFVLDQDSGKAITGPGRVDLFFGIGHDAGARAGRQIAPGRLLYLVLKRDARE